MDIQELESGEERLERGRAALFAALRALMTRNGLTNKQFRDLVVWANPWHVGGGVSTTMTSYIRHERTKTLGPAAMDALAQANLQLAKVAGMSSPELDTLIDLGEPPARLCLPDPPSIWCLRHPDTGMPLDAGGLFLIRVGRLMPEGLGRDAISDDDAKRLSRGLARFVQSWSLRKELLVSEGLAAVLRHYPPTDEARRRRLQLVLSGVESFNGETLLAELPAVGAMVAALSGAAPPVTSADLRELLGVS